jgi:diguanylate cyclase (GGDEF)-like protein/PAS domain S-box-containing protein
MSPGGGHEGERRFRVLLQHLPVGVYRTTPGGDIIEANQALIGMLGGRRLADLQRLNVKELYVRKKSRQEHLQRLTATPIAFSEFELRTLDGRTIWVRDHPRAIHDAKGRVAYIDGILVDITRRRLLEETIRQMAYQDSLTGLPNRSLLADRLERALASAKRRSQRVTLLYLDLDGFKTVNDSHGHGVGDQLLRIVATRLAGQLRQSDTVARLGGDEFLVLLPDAGRARDGERIARKILAEVRRPCVVGGRRLRVSASIGVAVYPQDGRSAETLTRHADQAMYAAKVAGRDVCRRYAEPGRKKR